jgi:hypothetical protein
MSQPYDSPCLCSDGSGIGRGLGDVRALWHILEFTIWVFSNAGWVIFIASLMTNVSFGVYSLRNLRDRSELKRSSGVEQETWIRCMEKEQAKCKEEVASLNNKIEVFMDEFIEARSKIEELRQQRAQAQEEEQQRTAPMAADVDDKQLVGFGQHAGMTYTDLAELHYKYIEWCALEPSPSSGMRRLLRWASRRHGLVCIHV